MLNDWKPSIWSVFDTLMRCSQMLSARRRWRYSSLRCSWPQGAIWWSGWRTPWWRLSGRFFPACSGRLRVCSTPRSARALDLGHNAAGHSATPPILICFGARCWLPFLGQFQLMWSFHLEWGNPGGGFGRSRASRRPGRIGVWSWWLDLLRRCLGLRWRSQASWRRSFCRALSGWSGCFTTFEHPWRFALVVGHSKTLI